MMRAEPAKMPDWFSGSAVEKPGAGRVLYTTRKYPIFYLMILKCGCTFLRNLFFHLDHNALHADAGRIHAHDDEFIKAAHIPGDLIRRSPYLFAVTRDPLDRFLSLYFDKFADTENQVDAWMRRRVGEAARLVLKPNLDLKSHQENCLRLLHWIRRNLDEGTEGRTNPHWQRQSVSIARVENLEPTLIPLGSIQPSLNALLSPIVPNIQQHMNAVTIRNASTKLYERDSFATPELTEMIQSIYEDDVQLFQRASKSAPRIGMRD